MAYGIDVPNYPCVRILVAGDQGVGKSTLIRRLCAEYEWCMIHGSASNLASTKSSDPSSAKEVRTKRLKFIQKRINDVNATIGANVDTMLYNSPAYSNQPIWVEFVDIGGSAQYTAARRVFYKNLDGIMLIYDAASTKSQRNAKRRWLAEIIEAHEASEEGVLSHPQTPTPSAFVPPSNGVFRESITRRSLADTPVVLVANKSDTVVNKEILTTNKPSEESSSLITLTSFPTESDYLITTEGATAGYPPQQKLPNMLQPIMQFIDRAIEHKNANIY